MNTLQLTELLGNLGEFFGSLGVMVTHDYPYGEPPRQKLLLIDIELSPLQVYQTR